MSKKIVLLLFALTATWCALVVRAGDCPQEKADPNSYCPNNPSELFCSSRVDKMSCPRGTDIRHLKNRFKAMRNGASPPQGETKTGYHTEESKKRRMLCYSKRSCRWEALDGRCVPYGESIDNVKKELLETFPCY
ncbi:MAG: hypothetical protein LBJ00_02640 [Planctomycetaceae bacterium]|jgi:hypothetical protein|nr:hypothetical protein [Planctomycetaceae bacterium]